MTRTGLALFSLPLAALCIGLSSAPAHADTAEALSELGSINGIALACQQPALASRARNAVQTGVAKTRENGERFEAATNAAFLAQGQDKACPDAATLAKRLEHAEHQLAQPSR